MKIVTDCAADMPAEELAELGIIQAPLYIHFPEGEVNSADISADEFYNRLEALQPEIPTTSQPSPGLLASIYRKLSAAGEQVLSIHLSSGLSGTVHAAQAAAQEVAAGQVTVWDTLTLSGGERFQVLLAALAAQAGATVQAIQARLARLRQRVEVVYTLDTLDYLARGGRIGRVKALAGALLHLKPVIRVDSDGKYSTVASARTLARSLEAIADHLIEKFAQTPLWVTVLHGRMAPQAEALADLLSKRLKVARLEVMRISPVLGVHTGPGIVGAAVVPVELMTI
jgi:DegV family protein with EDD domain